jgi:hypothetical protein
MGMTKIQLGVVSAFTVAFATAYLVQGNTNAGLRREISALAPPPQAAAALRAENERLASTAAEAQSLRQDDAELKRLEQQVAEVKQANDERARLAQARQQDLRQKFYDGIRADDARAQQEIDRMNREGNALVEDYKKLVAQAKDPAQTAAARANAELAAQAQLEAIKRKRQEIQAFTENVRQSLAQRVAAFRRAHGDDPNAPPPQPLTGAGRMELRRVPADDASTSAGWNLKTAPTPPDRASLPR